MVNRAQGTGSIRVGFYVSSAVTGVCAGLMSPSARMRQKKGSRSRFVKDVVSWPRKLVVSRSGQGSREAPDRVRSGPSRQMSIWTVQVRTRMRCLSPEGRRSDFPGASISQKGELAAYGGFCREENIIVFEARSVLYAVRYAESRYPLGRLLIFSDSLALVLALCKGRANTFTLLSVMRRIFASGFRAGFCLIVQVDTVRVELFRRGKSLL